jgi:hypothetical protein
LPYGQAADEAEVLKVPLTTALLDAFVLGVQ